MTSTDGSGHGCWTWCRADPAKAYADWLNARGEAFRAGVEVATLDPFHGYKNAIDDQLEDAIAVLDAFHVVKLGTQAVDEVRRRVQQDHPRSPRPQGRPALRDPELRAAARSGSPTASRSDWRRRIDADERHLEVDVAWQCAQQLRPVYHRQAAPRADGSPTKIIDSSPPARSPRSPGSAGPCNAGGQRSWPTSTQPARPTAAPKPSVSVVPAGLGLAGQDGPGRVVRCVTHEAIGPLRRCPSVELSAPSDAAGTVRPTSVT